MFYYFKKLLCYLNYDYNNNYNKKKFNKNLIENNRIKYSTPCEFYKTDF